MIPKTIHFIWVGNTQIPIENLNYIDKFKKIYFDYTIKVWNDNDINNNNIIPNFLFEYYHNNDFPQAFKADIVRYLLIQRYGGLYFDVDFYPIKRLSDNFLNFNFLGGIQNNGEITMSFFASISDNLILKKVIESIPDSIEISKSKNIYKSEYIHKITGPEFFNKIVRDHMNDSDCFFFSHEYFYPYWYTEENRKYENFEVTSPLSYAVHHWAKTWK